MYVRDVIEESGCFEREREREGEGGSGRYLRATDSRRREEEPTARRRHDAAVPFPSLLRRLPSLPSPRRCPRLGARRQLGGPAARASERVIALCEGGGVQPPRRRAVGA